MWRFLAQPRATRPAEASGGGKALDASSSADTAQPEATKDSGVLLEIQPAVNSSRGTTDADAEATHSPLTNPSPSLNEFPEVSDQHTHKENPGAVGVAGNARTATSKLKRAADPSSTLPEAVANPLALPSEGPGSADGQVKSSASELGNEDEKGGQEANGADLCPSPAAVREASSEPGVWDEQGEFERKMGPRPVSAKEDEKGGPFSGTAGETQGTGLPGAVCDSFEASSGAGIEGDEALEEAQAEVEEAVKEREEMEKRHKEGKDLIWRKGLSLNVELAKAKHLKESLKRSMKEAEKEHKADCIWARRRILNLQAEVRKHQEDTRSLQAEADRVKEQRRVEAELAQSEVACLEKELSALKHAKEGMEAENKRHLERCKAARRQVMQLKQEIASLQKEAGEARERRAVEERLAQGTLASLQQQKDELRARASGSMVFVQAQYAAPTAQKDPRSASCPEESEWQFI